MSENEAKLRDYLKRATADLRKARRRLGEVEAQEREPIAIVGMACRYPGDVSAPKELWDLVAEGRDAISELPADRGWDLERLFHPDPDHPGTSYAIGGGFLRGVAEFDAGFFGISPREALAMDPQQRLFLETCWEAFEDAGIDPLSQRGEPTGVFAGISSQEYSAGSEADARELEGYLSTGTLTSVVSGRVSYFLGLEGPAMTVDTACSSSLVALHLAMGALRGGECSLALAGGATTLSTPGTFTEFSRQRVLSPDGRCKSFAEAADGTGFSEGVGALLVERLEDAQRQGHPILAVLRGSAVNQDGASNGLTAPNGPSQERVIRQALANARLTPADIDAVEAHGTGTTLGDPIEAGALLATYGQEREQPLRLGSIKSNIGHTAAASGVAGVIKMVLAMREGLLPQTLHVDSPSSNVDWEAGEIELLTEAQPWQPNGKPRRAAVSSFGISGTNAHVILEEAPAPSVQETEQEGEPRPLGTPIPLALSAKTEPALAEAASRLASHLRESQDLSLEDLSYSLATTRALFEQRAVVLADDTEKALGALDALAQGKESPTAIKATATQGKLAYLFTGQGAQRAGMGTELYEASPAFKEALDEACAEIDPHLGISLRELLFAKPGSKQAELLDQTQYTQPALFALELALYRQLQSYGLKPDLLAGHSVGEITAAHIAGVLDLPDAAKLICARGKLMGELPKGGAMLAIEASEAEANAYLKGKAKELSIAALNSPTSTVLSGTESAIDKAQAHFETKGLKTKRLSVSHAFHSPLIEPMLADFAKLAKTLTYREPQIPVLSNQSAEVLTPAQATDPAYWVSHAREPVRFADSIEALHRLGATAYLEIGPEPALCPMAAATLGAKGLEAATIPTLREGRPEPEALIGALANAHANGAQVDWDTFFKGTAAKRVPLPTYPFQRKRYWLEGSTNGGDPASIGQASAEHPLLAAAIESPDTESLTLTGSISLQSHPWLEDHALGESVLLPGTAFLELALNAAERLGASQIGELTLQAPLILPEQGSVALQLTVSDPDPRGDRQIAIHSRSQSKQAEEEETQWLTHATGTLTSEAKEQPQPLEQWPPPGEPLDLTDAYERLTDSGLTYGPAFQGLSAAWRDGEDLYAEVSLAEEQVSEAKRFAIHPALLDAALHAAVLATGEQESPRLPFSWSDVSLHAQGASALRVKLTPKGKSISLQVADPEGTPVASVGSLATRELSKAQLQSARQSQQGLLAIEWQELSLPEGSEEIPPEITLYRPEQQDTTDPATAARAQTEQALTAVQEWLAAERPEDARFALVTEGALATTEEESPDLSLASAWGLMRSAQSEHPGSFVLIDSDGTEASQAAIARALQSDEPQVALREGAALVPRASSLSSDPDWLVPPAGPWCLDATKRGTLESLSLVPAPEASEPLGPNEVRVQMHAAGLNFRDVLIALGIYPGEASIGGEGAGIVTEVGEEVSDLTPGDRVMGLLSGAFGPVARTQRSLLIPAPEDFSFEQAAAIPTVFSTAYYGLVDLAALKPGEKVLVHAGAGGVGTAAIQIATRLGAEVFATASPSKWGALQALGLDEDHIASSRDLEFAERFKDAGIDVLLNSLAGEFVDASLGLLAKGGRFLEMGKTDIRDANELEETHPAISYLPFDLLEAGFDRLGELLATIAALFERGALTHSPIGSWDIRQAPVAFRHLREGHNVGKVVLTLPRPFDPEKTVLITGATGTLGSLIARHLVQEHGARHLLLTSRSGAKAKGAKELKAELKELGAKATIAACDVADQEQLKELLDSIPDTAPLGAIVHAAGTIDDGLIDSMTPERIEGVFAPKANGAWNLHRLTEDQDLSSFVLFSSLAGALGSPGQSNYAAANAFCDALAQERKARGLPATSIAWGLWATESEMTADLSEADLARMERSGIGALTDEEGLDLFDSAMASGKEQALAFRLVPAGLRAQAQAGVLHPLLGGLVRTPTSRRGAPSHAFAARLAEVSEAERGSLCLELVREEAAAVLGHGSDESIEAERPFKDLGFDSLAAVELRNRLSTLTGLRLAPTLVFDYPTTAKLAVHLLAEVTASGATARATRRAQATDEPIAILGMACRYPGGVSDPTGLWQLLSQGQDGISEFPTDRGWDIERLFHPDPDHPGTTYAKEGGFMEAADHFDAEFFGISPREAIATDPQQRLLLEACWEALEDAGIDPSSLGESQTGVFAGVMGSDYGPRQGSAPGELEGYITTGVAGSVASGRVAYTLGLEGPAMTVDTACSSSLVAMHLASQALRSGECDMALAGGVTVFSSAGLFTEFSRQRGLAPDGRSKSFADAADGAGFSEGVGTLLLARLSDAQREGHPILAVLRGSAVNQDGASNGLTAPNGPSQERVIRQALANARLTPADIDAVEAHGTGTTLGDPIEAGALLATYGQDREEPLRLGSIKSNIGHTQAAAGVAGVIKMVLAMREGLLPQTLHVDSPSSNVDWEAGEIELLTEAQPWQPNGKPRRAAVSSFGISGTNAHVILEEAPAPSVQETEQEGEPRPLGTPIPLALSAKTEPALQEAAARLHTHLKANPDLELPDLSYSLATTRALFEQRAVVLAEDTEKALGALDALAQGKESPTALKATATQGKLAYLFTGQGAQRAGMGTELYEASPAFKEALDEACAEIDQHLGISLRELLFAKPGSKQAELLDQTQYTQPALFALELALYRQLQSYGLKPDLLAGHSVGEITAAHIAGVLDLPDAAKLICARGKLMGELPKGGAMVAIEASEAEATSYLKGKAKELSIAALNSPTSTVLSGTESAIDKAQAHFETKGLKTKRLSVSHAFHSPLIEPMLADFAKLAKTLTYREPQIPVLSNQSAEVLAPAQATDPAYWVSHVREPVRFADSIEALHRLGATAYLEIGPEPALCPMAAATLGAKGLEAATIPTLREGRPEPEALIGALANAHANGAQVDWDTFFKGTAAKRVPLPTYPFQRKRYWLEGSTNGGDPASIGQASAEHPLLAAAIESPDTESLTLTGSISLQSHPWLEDHALGESVLLPGTAFLELALNAAERLGASQIGELTLQAPLILPEQGSVALQLTVSDPDPRGDRQIAIHSRSQSKQAEEEETQWLTHATGTLTSEAKEQPQPLEQWPPPGEPLDLTDAYERLTDSGLTYGPAFQGLSAAWRDGEDLYAEVSLAEEQVSEAKRFAIHPALLDAALHAAVLAPGEESQGPRLPFSWSDVSLQGQGASALRVKLTPQGQSICLQIADQEGNPVAQVGSLATRELSKAQLQSARQSQQGLLGIEWQELSLPEGSEEIPAEVTLYRPESKDTDADPATAARAQAEQALTAVQEWLAAERPEDARFALVTEGALATKEGESPELSLASAWGLMRSAQSEHPGSFVLIDSDGTEASQAAIAGALQAEEPQLALREGAAFVPRATRMLAPAEEQPPSFDPDKTVLITGATGTLGSLIARHLVQEHGARHLLLTSRSGAKAKGAKELKAELKELGAKATIAACDVSEEEQVKELLGSIPDTAPLGAIVHAAGTIDDGLIDSMSPERIEGVFAPKADGAWNLHRLTEDQELSSFVLFSSLAGALGSPAQSNYAAANAFCDALAQERKAKGLPATSIAWGLWATESEMTSGLSEADLARMERSGIGALSDEEGLDLFDSAMASGKEQALAFRLIPAGLRAQAQAGVLHPLLGGLVRVSGGRRSAASGAFAAKLAEAPEAEREALALELVRSEVGMVLGHETGDAIDPTAAFKDLGFDSLAAVELRNRLSTLTGLRLAPTLVFDYPTSAKLAAHLLVEATASGATKQAVRLRSASDEPIAILGMACRYPGGVSDPTGLWQLLSQGQDGISEFPTDRGWDIERLFHPDPDHPGTTYAKEGGFMEAADHFDAEFFGISPREAIATDPQQRLLLEACWEALEDAGIDPSSLGESQTGVFAGVMYQDYGSRLSRVPDEVEGYLAAGGSGSVVSGRISYTLGLEGPAMTVDTACSSSLVTLHLAAQALRSGECDMALAGGVTFLSTPKTFTEFSRQRGLAPDGRCKSFSDSADGTGWSEGVGMLLVARLSDAQREGHPILAVLRGSAVNQDGASNGLTAPNGPSQERVIRQALANARLTPQDIDAVEAHGTGTTLGDPIEAGALLATYGQDREEPLRLGSIKSNIGHTQAAAGVAGVIKMVLAMREGLLPQTLHVDSPSSNVDWEAGEIELLTEPQPWQPNGKPRRAAVSSFGISGTNAHVILEEAPAASVQETEQEGEPRPLGTPIPLALSAKTEPALQEAASRLASHLRESQELSLEDLAYSLATTRALFEQRAVVLADDTEKALGALDALAQGKESPTALKATATQGKLAYLFTGQGAQRAGMGTELYEASPAFKEALDEACAEIDQHLGISLRELLFAKPGSKQAELLDQTQYTQPALFALELALYRQLQSYGLKPDLLAGHSVGEITAAHIAGVLDLPDAAKLICARGKLMGELPKGGAMVAIEASEAEATSYLKGKAKELSIAALNSPTSTVLSGTESAIDKAQAHFETKGLKTKRLSVSHAFHSPLIEPMLADFAKLAKTLTYREPQIPVLSNQSAEVLAPAQATDPAYWVSHVREPVRFADSIEALHRLGATAYLEIGPEPALCPMAAATLGAKGLEAATIPTLREGRPEPEALIGALANAHANGAQVDWDAFFKGTAAKRVPLPTYPFQRKRYWLEGSAGAGDLSAAGLTDLEHPLLAAAIESPDTESLTLTGSISLQSHPWLEDHALGESVLLPGTAFLELALNAAERLGASQIGELTLQAPLILPEQGSVALQLTVSDPDPRGDRQIAIHSRSQSKQAEEEETQWLTHATGTLTSEAKEQPQPLEQWPPPGEPLDLTDAYERLTDAGLTYGPAFQGLSAAWQDGEDLYAEVSLAEEQVSEAKRFAIHPALLDAALHAAVLATGEQESPRLPFSWSDVSLHAQGASALRVKLTPKGQSVSLQIADPEGNPVAQVGSLATRELSKAQLQSARQAQQGLLGIEWQELSLPEGSEEIPAEVTLYRPESKDTDADPATAARAQAEQALAAVQEWLAAERPEDARFALVTEGALATTEEESPDLSLASAWGLMRSAQSEHPGSFVLIDSDGTEASQAAIAGALQSDEPQVALREGAALVPRATRLSPPTEEQPSAFDPEKTVLITGATGTLGSLIARHLVQEHGARHLLLTSRSGAKAKGAKELKAELKELGAKATIAACDVSEEEQVKELLGSIPDTAPLGAIVHAAGTIDDGLIDSMSPERIEGVFAPKADGAWNLHRLTEDQELSSFVLFSSLAGALGSPAQSNYAAANAFCDALAQERKAKGLPATSIAWGLWATESEMTAGLSEADLARMERSGIGALSDEEGLDLFDSAMASGKEQALAFRLVPSGLRAQAQAGVLHPLLGGLVRVSGGRRSAASGAFAAKLAEAPEAEREALALELVRSEVGMVLGHETGDAIDPTAAFKDLGFDSLAAVELRNRLSTLTGLRLAPTLVFDYPTTAVLASYLLAEVVQRNEAGAHAELDRLEQMLTTIPAEDPSRLKLAAHLRALAGDLERNASSDGDALDADRLESASDEELLDFIDQQVGAGEST